MCVVKTAFLFTFLQSFQIVWWIRYLNWFRPPHAGQPRQKEERRPKYGLSQYTHIWAGLQPLCPDTNTGENETKGNLPGTSPSPLLTGHPISNIDFWTEMSRLHISFFSVNLYFNWKGFRPISGGEGVFVMIKSLHSSSNCVHLCLLSFSPDVMMLWSIEIGCDSLSYLVSLCTAGGVMYKIIICYWSVIPCQTQ